MAPITLPQHSYAPPPLPFMAFRWFPVKSSSWHSTEPRLDRISPTQRCKLSLSFLRFLKVPVKKKGAKWCELLTLAVENPCHIPAMTMKMLHLFCTPFCRQFTSPTNYIAIGENHHVQSFRIGHLHRFSELVWYLQPTHPTLLRGWKKKSTSPPALHLQSRQFVKSLLIDQLQVTLRHPDTAEIADALVTIFGAEIFT